MALTDKAGKSKFEEGSELDTQVMSEADKRVAEALAKKSGKGETKPEAEPEPEPEVAAAETKAPSQSREVAAKPAAGALATKMAEADPFAKLENAIHVDYNTLTRIDVSNGNVRNKDTKKLMGDTCVLELVSIQKHWVMSPGGDKDDEESAKFLKYSEDGKTCKDTGEPLETYRAAAIAAGYTKARINERLILVGMLVDAGKLKDMEGELVQMDCAPRTLANFNRHRITTAFRLGKNMVKAEGAEIVRITAEVQSANGNDWTDGVFSAYTPA